MIFGPVGLILVGLLVVAAGLFVMQRLSGNTPINVMGTLRQKGTITIGVPGDISPLGYEDVEGNLAGFEVELAQQLGDRILGPDSTVLVVVTPKTRGAYINQSKCDILIASVDKNEANQKAFNMGEVYLQDDVLFLGASNADIDLYSKDTIIGVLRGSNSKTMLEAHMENNKDLLAQVVTVPSHPEALEMLENMEIDFYCNDRSTLSDKWLKEGFRLTGPIVGKQNYAITCRLREKDLFAEIERAYTEIKTDGTLKELYRKYNLTPPKI